MNQDRMILGQEQRDLDKQKVALKARRDQLVDHEMREAEAINLVWNINTRFSLIFVLHALFD